MAHNSGFVLRNFPPFVLHLQKCLVVVFIGTVGVQCCFLPEFKSPLDGLHFKSLKGYPRTNITAEIELNKNISHDIRRMGRMRAHERKVLSVFPEKASIENIDIPHSSNVCTIQRKYFVIRSILVDKDLGDCWVLWQWRGINITWTECERYCKDVPARPPFYLYVCLPSHIIEFSFWAFCPLYRKFIMKTVELPQCCSCNKYDCLIQPKIIKVGTY